MSIFVFLISNLGVADCGMKNVYIMLNGAKRNEASIKILRCTQNDKSYLIQQRRNLIILSFRKYYR